MACRLSRIQLYQSTPILIARYATVKQELPRIETCKYGFISMVCTASDDLERVRKPCRYADSFVDEDDGDDSDGVEQIR